MTALRLLLMLLLTALAVFFVAQRTRRSGLLPRRLMWPSREETVVEGGGAGEVMVRRTLAVLILGGVLFLSVAAPVGAFGLEVTQDLGELSSFQLFSLHALFGFSLVALYVIGYLPHGRRPTSLWAQYGFRAESIGRELLIGSVAGVGIWLVVILLLFFLSALVALFGGSEALPQEPPAMVTWIAGLPIAVRIAVCLSAGLFEEAFFRGLLQPRVGIGWSTSFFAVAHLSYDQPFLLVGVTVLSLLFSWLVVWRQSLWASIAAHSMFDLIQLLVVIPSVLWLMENQDALGSGLD